MALPEKEYFSLHEIAERWGTTLDNLAYYINHEMIQVQAWLPRIKVEVFFWEETPDGDSFSCPCGSKMHQGYVIVSAADCREIFKGNGDNLQEFNLPGSEMIIRVANPQQGYTCTPADLCITKAERDRFENAHHIQPAYEVCELTCP